MIDKILKVIDIFLKTIDKKLKVIDKFFKMTDMSLKLIDNSESSKRFAQIVHKMVVLTAKFT